MHFVLSFCTLVQKILVCTIMSGFANRITYCSCDYFKTTTKVRDINVGHRCLQGQIEITIWKEAAIYGDRYYICYVSDRPIGTNITMVISVYVRIFLVASAIVGPHDESVLER